MTMFSAKFVQLVIFLCLEFCWLPAVTEREHKVHNIVLYPEKHSWCQTTKIQQVVASQGYDPVTIDNNVCVGACFSYSIPKTQPAEPGELIGPYCDSCQPSEIKCYHINLQSGGKRIQKRVQIIQNCSCMTCDKINNEDCDISDENTVELPQAMFSKDNETIKHLLDDAPELLHIPKDHKRNRDELSAMFKHIDLEGDDLNNKNEDEVKYTVINYNTLEHNEENNRKIEADLEGRPLDYGLEGSPTHFKGHHIGMGIGLNDNIGSNHHVHHLGEEQHLGSETGHLVKGPHNSMVLEPVEAKLHIDTDTLKPNDEGVVMTYENHHHRVIDNLDN